MNPYGASKFMIERMLKDFHHAYGLKYIALRYFNAAGADPDAEIGEVHSPETHLILLILDVALGKLPKLTVFGNTYPTADGTCIRDYIHVTNLARAHVLSLKAIREKRPGPFIHQFRDRKGPFDLSDNKGFRRNNRKKNSIFSSTS